MKNWRAGITACALPVLLIIAPPVFADTPEACQPRYQSYQRGILTVLNLLESDYIRYRWAEFEGRRMMYERIWQARTDGNDPLAKTKREMGREEELRLKDALNEINKESEDAANGFVKKLDSLFQKDAEAPQMCGRPDFRVCLLQANAPFYRVMKEIKAEFEKVFEHEREYRTVVENASGGREGLYPDDYLEPSKEHTDLYWRFEQPRSQERFIQDSRFMDLLAQARKILTTKFPGDLCCLDCH